MKPRLIGRWLAALTATAAVLLITGAAVAADINVMISAGFFHAYSALAPAFEQASGHRLVTTRGPSFGDSPEAIGQLTTENAQRAFGARLSSALEEHPVT